jgi:hypothetical protein
LKEAPSSFLVFDYSLTRKIRAELRPKDGNRRISYCLVLRTTFKSLTGQARRSGWWVAGALALVLISCVFAAGEIDGKPEKSEVTIALPQPSGAPIPVFLAHESGLFKKHGINAKIQILNSAVSVQAVVSGDADIFAGGATLSNARLRGAPFKFFGATTQQYVFQMYGAKEITNVQQLKGKPSPRPLRERQLRP